MKVSSDIEQIAKLVKFQRGVFSTSDLKSALAERHPAGFKRRIRALLDREILFRFTRGFYVSSEFDLATLSQRIAPRSTISFATVLADLLIIGTNPTRKIVATKTGRTRNYAALGFEIEHVGFSARLDFGCIKKKGVRYADAEKAMLDVLYFHLRGRRVAFDIYSDVNLRKLNKKRLLLYLGKYRNPKFVTFAKRVLKIT